jgi:signal peptidase II
VANGVDNTGREADGRAPAEGGTLDGAGARDAEPRVRARPWWIASSVATIVLLDQLTKSWAVNALADGPKEVFGASVRFELARNSGSAFSRFRGYTPILALLAIVITVFIARAARRATDRWLLVGLTLVLGGALGNLCDRIFRAPGFLRGHVIDFVAVGWYPVFNVADSCITIGAIVIIVRTLFTRESPAVGPHDG